MRSTFSLRVFCLIAAAITPLSAAALEITTSLNQRFQTMEGWGAAGNNSRFESPAVREAYRDLGMNLFRVSLDFRTLRAAENDYRIRVPLIGNTLQENVDKFNFGLREPQQRAGDFAGWLTENALEPDRAKIVGSVWTPPHWMKGPTGRSSDFVGVLDAPVPTPFLSNMHVPWNANNPRPTGDSVGGRLRTEDPTTLEEYGEYMAAHVTAFEQEYGIDMYALSIQNESTFENPFISMTLDRDQNGGRDPNQYALALNSVRQAWERHGLDAKIKGPHVAMSGQREPNNPFRLNDQMAYINAVKNFGDGSLIDFLDYYNTNGYARADDGAAQLWAGYYHGRDAVPEANWASWATSITGVSQDGKGIWQSETGGDSPTSWRTTNADPGAIGVALKMHNAIVHADTSAYIYWQFIDGNSTGTHSLVGENQISNPEQSMKYSAFKHFSRYVRPGADRIGAAFANGHATTGGANQYDGINGVNVSAFVHDEDETLTYVLINMENSSRTITLNLPEELALEDFQAFRSTSTERFNQLADLTVLNGEISFTMPSNSLLTLVGSFAGEPVIGDYNGDGLVDAADFTVWQNSYGGDNLAADGNGDGVVDAADYTVWRDAADAAAASVPEPAGLLLLTVAGVVAASRRNRVGRGGP